MAITRYNRIFPTIWSPFFDDDSSTSQPVWPEVSTTQGMDMYETDDELIVQAPIPGVPEDKVEVTVEGNILTIKGSFEETKEEKDKKKVVYKSTRQSTFNYSTSLPRMVDGSKAVAEVENGVVKVSIPKAEEEKPKKIEVKKK